MEIKPQPTHVWPSFQIAKNTAFPVNGVYHPCNAIPEGTSPSASSLGGASVGGGGEGGSDGGGGGLRGGVLVSSTGEPGVPLTVSPTVQTGIEVGRECAEAANALAGMRQRSPGKP